MFSPISIDYSFLSLSADLLPDTSGLAPLTLPPEFLSRSQTPPTPDAIRRFQSAISNPIPPPEATTQETSSAQLPPSPLHALPVTAPEQPAPPPAVSDSSSLPPLRVSAPPREIPSPTPSTPAAPTVLPPPADLAKKADLLARLLFSHFEAIPYEITERREINIPLPPAILDATSVILTPKDDTLLITLSPSTPDAAPLTSALLPYLSNALPSRLPASPHIQVVLSPVTSPAPAASSDTAAPVPPPLQAAPFSAPVPLESSPVVPASDAPVSVSPVISIAPASESPARNQPSIAVFTPPAPMAPAKDITLSSVPQSTPAPDVAPLADLLVSRLATIPPAELELREIRLPLDSLIPLTDSSIQPVPSVSFTVQNGTLRVTLPSSAQFPVANLLPHLAETLETRLPAFSRVQVVLESSAAPTPPLAPAESKDSVPQTLSDTAPAPLSVPPSESSPHPTIPVLSSIPSIPAPSGPLPPPADLAQQAAQVAEVLFSRLETLPPATLESREIRIPLAPTLLDASTVVVTVKEDVLLVTVAPSTPEVIPVVSSLLPHLVELLPTRFPSFPLVEVSLAPSPVAIPSSPALPPSLRVSAPPREIPSPSVLPPPADLAQQAVQVAEVLFSNLAPLPPATLESREIRIPLPPTLLDASTVGVTVKEDVLLVTVVPSTPEVVPVASALLPHIAELVQVRLPAFPCPQVVLATPETPRIAALPEDTSRPATREIPPSEVLRPVSSPSRPTQVSDQEPAPLQALPFSVPTPLETIQTPSDSRPQASRPIVPVQPVAPTLESSPTFVAAKSPRQLNSSPAQDPETPPPPLQAIPFAPPIPLEATASTSTPLPSPAPIPPSTPAMPAEAPSLPGTPTALSAQSPANPPAPAPQTSARRPDVPQPAGDQTIKPSNHPTIQPSAPPRDNPAPLQAAPVDVPPPAASPVPLADPTAVASAASARTASIAETVDQIASAVASRILVTPSLRAGGDGQIRITLQPAVLDGSTVTLTARNGTLAVAVVPATPEAAALAAAALPQLAAAMEAHAPAFRRVQVSLASKKGNPDETV